MDQVLTTSILIGCQGGVDGRLLSYHEDEEVEMRWFVWSSIIAYALQLFDDIMQKREAGFY